MTRATPGPATRTDDAAKIAVQLFVVSVVLAMMITLVVATTSVRPLRRIMRSK